MDGPIYTREAQHQYRPTPCPSCGQRRELGWRNVGSLTDANRYTPSEQCRNAQCDEYRDPTGLA